MDDELRHEYVRLLGFGGEVTVPDIVAAHFFDRPPYHIIMMKDDMATIFQWVDKTRRTHAAKQLPIAKYERNMQRTLLEHLLEDQFVLDRIPLAEIESVSSADSHSHVRVENESAFNTAATPASPHEVRGAVSDDEDDIYLEKEEAEQPKPQENEVVKEEITYRSSTDSESETCPICLDDFEDGADVKVLPCQHFFHVDCINPWLEGRIRLTHILYWLRFSVAGASKKIFGFSLPRVDQILQQEHVRCLQRQSGVFAWQITHAFLAIILLCA
ncbi:unnamed protein product [Phytophthora lilii]|uniref:Unnamed protein product n=1 Tax=Phytophthora lilii TaxID=2077276 RepID=A0A9W6TH69_9STRA|nr:unnamed protein product [Phytophthora lilii]